MSISSREPELDPCGCCETDLPRPTHYNRPGQPALAYRIGTHSTFLCHMLGRLYVRIIPGGPTLSDLTTRASDDPAIALLDAWAAVADVLTFYQERIVNEGYLRTGTERRSVLELARAIGYELNPGVAASAYLAFTADDSPGASKTVAVPTGTQIQSVPSSKDKLPQTFETVEEIEARGEWNALQPRTAVAQVIGRGTTQLYLKGIDTNLQPGDAILLVGAHRESWPGSERWDFRILKTVTPYPKEGHTLVTWEAALGHIQETIDPADNPKVFAFRQRAALFGHNAPDWRAMPDEVKEAYGGTGWDTLQQWPDFAIENEDDIYLDAAYPKILAGSWIVLSRPAYQELYRAVQVSTDSRTDFTLTAKTTRIQPDTREHLDWFSRRRTVVFAQSEQLELAEEPLTTPVYGKQIVLDRVVEGLFKGQAVIVIGKPAQLVTVAPREWVVRVGDREITKQKGDLSLVSAEGSGLGALRSGDELGVLGAPLSASGGNIKWHLKDKTGQSGFVMAKPGDIIVQPAGEEAETVAEVAFIDLALEDGQRTTLMLKDALANTYDRTTVAIYANVAKATHGETVKEALGSGDGAKPHQRFKLNKKPLTYVSAATASGGESTLEVRVNDVLWKEAWSLYGLDAGSESYIVRMADDGTASVIFGDGKSGARLPTGLENVKATYRSGIGPDGEVGANSLTLLKTRPLGIRGATNPVAASGAAAPEALDEARVNAPLTVLTLDRIVSLRDFEDFARAFAGIGKARAVALWDGETRLVHVTVASSTGKPIATTTPLYANLVKAMRAACDPMQAFLVSDHTLLSFNLRAKVRIDPRYVADAVLSDVQVALTAAFSFEERALGQPVTAAEVVTVISQVAGVVAVDLDQLYLSTDPNGPNQEVPDPILPASTADWNAEKSEIQPAQLLLINPAGVTLLKMEEPT